MVKPRVLTLSILLVFTFSSASNAQVCIDLGGSNPYSHLESYDGLGSSPAPQNGDLLNIQMLNAIGPRRYLGKFDSAVADNSSPVNFPGWAVVEEGSNASSVTGRYNTGNGSANGGNTYSFGTNSDRALGSLNDDTVSINYIGGCYRNMTGTTLNSVAIGFTGEMWRRGASGSQTDVLSFAFAVNATNIYSGAFAAYAPFDFVTPNVSGAAGARDGNAASYRAVFPQTLLPVSLAPGDSLYVRWVDQNIAGADDGLAIDDFSISMLPPSAADASIAGRVFSTDRRAIGRALMTLTDDSGKVRVAVTNTFVYYRFANVQTGRSYILSVAAKGVTFETPSIVVNLQDSLGVVNFVALPPAGRVVDRRY